MRTPLPIICQACQKTFYVYNSFYINKRPIKCCSTICSNNLRRLSQINDNYFETITDDNKHTLGQVIACGIIADFRDIIITSDELTLKKIQTKIGSNHKLNPAELGKLQLKITSSRMVENLHSHGLSTNPYFQEYPEYDILSGLIDTDCYKEVGGVRTFRHKSHKLILEMQYHLGGEIITETFKDVPRGGVIGCYWILVW